MLILTSLTNGIIFYRGTFVWCRSLRFFFFFYCYIALIKWFIFNWGTELSSQVYGDKNGWIGLGVLGFRTVYCYSFYLFHGNDYHITVYISRACVGPCLRKPKSIPGSFFVSSLSNCFYCFDNVVWLVDPYEYQEVECCH